MPSHESIYKIYAPLLQVYIFTVVYGLFVKTQYGCRNFLSTVIPLACICRVCEGAEASNKEIHLVVLDWASAFDKIKTGLPYQPSSQPTNQPTGQPSQPSQPTSQPS